MTSMSVQVPTLLGAPHVQTLPALLNEFSVQVVGSVSTTLVVPLVLLPVMMLWPVIVTVPVIPCVKGLVCVGVTVTSGAGSTVIDNVFESTPVVIALPVRVALLLTVPGAVAVGLTLKLIVRVSKLFPGAMNGVLLKVIDGARGALKARLVPLPRVGVKRVGKLGVTTGGMAPPAEPGPAGLLTFTVTESPGIPVVMPSPWTTCRPFGPLAAFSVGGVSVKFMHQPLVGPLLSAWMFWLKYRLQVPLPSRVP